MFQDQLILNTEQFNEIYEYVQNNYKNIHPQFFRIDPWPYKYKQAPVQYISVDLFQGTVHYYLKEEYGGNFDIYLTMGHGQIKTLSQFLKLAQA